MPPSTQASFFWVKYGFDNLTPPKMYNANVSCAILRSFVKNTCARDVEDLCKQKYIQLGIELDTLNKALQAAQAHSAATPLATDRSSASVHFGGTSSRPPSGAASSRPITPTTQAGSNGSADDSLTEIVAKKTATENQLQVVAAASKLAKELIAGIATVDLADDHGTRLKLDEIGDARANTILKSRAQYTAVAITVDDKGSPHVVPLVFKLQKPPNDAPLSRPSSGAAKSTAAAVPT
ncbi:hypothetical protein PC129_g4597 [Phytophthora cactorum]|uniref:Uncharacterized protein n=1 Tax=Phytophthora cactorum TaxID=29920 RepID=A0A329S1Q7_9STRA|nr:hypothetical protein Pcac1_g14168 [Phytophthora cactorum]KAG2833063.1 hypothetical protein PC112_g6643 [Phytophthora cactorum]KAG2835196.1 hypothetical protein PC111_g5518 [Phytophthora cactorum]KAG2860133.1 hypothetical protein PC113_g8321 [Phytophthora cactorum]KAG2913578.1 hypothetical protein PC114_g8512 [Phytophthora cactorum]